MEKPIISSRTVSFKINFPFSLPFESHGELVWSEQFARGDRYFCGVQFLRLENNELAVLREAVFKFNYLNTDFITLTKNFRSFISDIKKKFDAFDTVHEDEMKRYQFIKQNESKVFNDLDMHFEQAWDIVHNLNKEEYQLQQK